MEIGHEGNGEQEGCRMITIVGNLSLCGWSLGPLFDDQVRSCTNICRDGSTNFLMSCTTARSRRYVVRVDEIIVLLERLRNPGLGTFSH